jgi:hypothetical protein
MTEDRKIGGRGTEAEDRRRMTEVPLYGSGIYAALRTEKDRGTMDDRCLGGGKTM